MGIMRGGGRILDVCRERLIREFKSLVSIDSPSLGEKQLGEYIKNRLASLGLNVDEDGAGEALHGSCGNLYARLEGEPGAEPLLFSAHMDTVEPSRGKRAIVGEDGVIRGGGNTVLGADDCAGIAAILEALQVILERNIPHHPIELLFTVAEEKFSKGCKHFDFSRLRAREAYVLDLDGPIGAAANEAPTIISFEAVIHGKAAHAGFAPEDGVHAISAAADAISRLRMGRIGDDTTFNIGMIEGGGAVNIVPDRCRVRGEIRSLKHAKALEQAELVERHFSAAAMAIGASCEFSSELVCRAYRTPPSHPVVRRFEKACEFRGYPTRLLKTFGGSDNNSFAEHGIAGIVIASAMHRCHSCEEYTTVDELCCLSELTVSLMSAEECRPTVPRSPFA